MSTRDEQSLEGGGLSLRFRFEGDRFAHQVWLADGSSWVHVLSSVEGPPADIWPSSPPLQSLQIEDRQGGHVVAFLVGMAGQSHWSASVELDAGVPCLRFDIACRVHREEVGQLGSSYKAAWPTPAEDGSHAILVADKSWAKGLIVAVDPRPAPARLRQTIDGVIIHAANSLPSSSTRTIRWGYTIAVASVATASHRGR